jgi:hypothetical protein
MSRTSSTAVALEYDQSATARPQRARGLASSRIEPEQRSEPWRSETLVRVVRDDSVVHFTASSRGQARQLLDQALDLLIEMDARRARRSHLHPSWR